MGTFAQEYEQLNERQQHAVDTIDGPVLVVAGPGTGKTQLLATRVANILQKDSTLLPTNILCLTFTDAGQAAMQRRLVEIMGNAGAHVAVHTFHSFGTEIISSYPEYFNRGSVYAPTDELTTYEILKDILEHLPYTHPLATQNQGDFVYLQSIKQRVAQLKKAALTPGELRELIADSLKFIDFAEATITELFDVKRFATAGDIDRAATALQALNAYRQRPETLYGFKPLSTLCLETFKAAIESARASGKPKAINDWKKPWFTKDKDGRAVCKQRAILDKLLGLADIYEQYIRALDERQLFDFDDMIMRVVHALETRADLAYELQEQYQYFLVDEFQDTNAGQLRLLHALASHPVNEQRPNVLVVGDDDQAIYAFQGAELSNILDFKESYKDVELVTLTDNYRSSTDILALARQIILQGEDRLENRYAEINKALKARAVSNEAQLNRREFATQNQEFEWLASQIKQQLDDGYLPAEIAVICREHKHLEALLPYLYAQSIPVTYQRRTNALDQPQILELITLAEVVNHLAQDNLSQANGRLPELLSADYWQIPAAALWQLSLSVRRRYEETRQPVYWLELMLSGEVGEQLKDCAEFLVEAAKRSRTLALEETLDLLIGNTAPALADEAATESDQPPAAKPVHQISPFKAYYFADDALTRDPQRYITLLNSLSALRGRLRQYRPDARLQLNDFVQFAALCKQAGIQIPVHDSQAAVSAITLTSTHGSKGLEFGTVYALSCVRSIWDKKGRGSSLPLAPNMLTISHQANQDDALRLFYVALTRAKERLIISSFTTGSNGKQQVPFGALEHSEVQAVLPRPEILTLLPVDTASQLEAAERAWQDKHFRLPVRNMQTLLAGRLETYRISATHLNNFLDVTGGGPQAFLLGNLLQFPSAMSPSAAYGSAMHSALEQLHRHFGDHAELMPVDELLGYFRAALAFRRLTPRDEANYQARGETALRQFYTECGPDINASQRAEQDFFAQGSCAGEARLTGKLDVLEVSGQTASIVDYKTGGALNSWQTTGLGAYEKIKQHKYRQQLHFYKLLVDGARSYGGRGVRATCGELLFVEPDSKGKLSRLTLNLDDSAEQDRLTALIGTIWSKIMNLDFPDVSAYSQDLKGIKQFEDDLLSGTI